jgi:hypothetical protein
MYGINPYTQQSYSWYDGSTDDFGYVGSDATLSGQDYSAAVAAYDLDFEAGMTDLGQDEYIAQYMSERENDDPNNPAQDVPGWWEGIWGSSQDPIAIQAQQAIATTNANAAAAIQAEAEAAQAEAQAEAAAQQQQLDLMYNMYTGYTNQQLGLVTDSISAQIGDINTQIAANQGQTTTELAQLSALQNELYGATNNQIDSLNAQLTNLTDTSNNQYSQLTAAQQTQYNDILSQLETVEGSLTQQINDSYTGPYNNTDFLDMANPQPGVYTLNPVTGQYVGQSSVSFNNPYADSDLSSLGEQLGTGPGTSFTPSDSGGTVTVSTDTGSTSYDTTDLGGGQHSVDVSSDGEGPDSDVGWEDPNAGSSDSSSSSSSSSSDSCFVTTATLQEVDTKDDGKELTTFRDFRDNYLKNKSYGPALVRDYYNNAPRVVAEIDSRQNHKQLYQSIWKEHLRPINRLIEKGEEAEATSKYMLMMEELKEKFLPNKGER